MITQLDAVENFHKLLVKASQSEVVIRRESAKEARAFRQRLYRLRDLYLSVLPSALADASALAQLLEFRVIGRHVYVQPKDPTLATELLRRIPLS